MTRAYIPALVLLCLVTGAPAQGESTVVRGFGGKNTYGQLNAPADLTNAVSIAAGRSHSLALKPDGTVVAWGGSSSLGSGVINGGWNSQDGTQVPKGLTNVVAISAGENFSLALKADGTMVAWGANSYGQTNLPPGLTNLAAISAGIWHCLVLKSNGTVVAWGIRDEGNEVGRSVVPFEITNGVAIAAGGGHNLVLDANGKVIGWGLRESGPGVVPEGLCDVAAIAAGMMHSLALKRDGTVVGWGFNRSCAATGTPSPDIYPWRGSGVVTLAGKTLKDVISVSAGTGFSLALRRDGTVVGWGNAPSFGGLSNIVAIAAADDHFLVLQRRDSISHR